MNIIEATYKWNGELKKRTITNYIVLHHADASTCSVQDIHQWHLANGWTGFGYHFLIRKDGMIYRGRPIDTVGAHCLNHNEESIGICFEGAFNKEQPTEKQILSVIDLIFYLKGFYKDAKVVGHKELVTTTECPGNLFPLDTIKAKTVVPKQDVHWAKQYFDKLNANGVKINEERYDDKITRGETFALLSRLLDTLRGDN